VATPKTSIKKTGALKQALEKLSSKQHVVSDTAIQAKKDIATQGVAGLTQRQQLVVEELQTSVHLLTSVLHHTRLDQLVSFMANPARMLFVNFCLGIVKGLGFGIGLILLYIAYLSYF